MELARIETYGEFKEALGTELKNQAEGFVRTGYLLKVARDTDILRESEFQIIRIDLIKQLLIIIM